MKVSDLIEKLSVLPSDAEVLIDIDISTKDSCSNANARLNKVCLVDGNTVMLEN